MTTKIFHPVFSVPWRNFARSWKLLLGVQKQLGCISSRDLFDAFSKVDAITLLQVGIKTGPLFLVPETRLSAEELGSNTEEGAHDGGLGTADWVSPTTCVRGCM
jgi:hypothetical protein